MEKDRSIPAAILLGSVIIAAGLYFGLNKNPPAPEQTLSPLRTTAAPPAANPPPVANPGTDVVTPALQKKATEDAARALEGERSKFVETCWAPAIKATPQPTKSEYSFLMIFNASGKEVGRGISEFRDKDSRPDVANCLRRIPLGLSIPAPGVDVRVEVLLKLP